MWRIILSLTWSVKKNTINKLNSLIRKFWRWPRVTRNIIDIVSFVMIRWIMLCINDIIICPNWSYLHVYKMVGRNKSVFFSIIHGEPFYASVLAFGDFTWLRNFRAFYIKYIACQEKYLMPSCVSFVITPYVVLKKINLLWVFVKIL